MQTLDAQLKSIEPQLASLVHSLLPSRRWLITRYDEPCEDCDYATEEGAQARADEATEEDSRGRQYDIAPVSLQLTIGFTPKTEERDCSWHYQTGDNSYSGGAYGHPAWGVTWLTADSVPETVASELTDEIANILAQ